MQPWPGAFESPQSMAGDGKSWSCLSCHHHQGRPQCAEVGGREQAPSPAAPGSYPQHLPQRPPCNRPLLPRRGREDSVFPTLMLALLTRQLHQVGCERKALNFCIPPIPHEPPWLLIAHPRPSGSLSLEPLSNTCTNLYHPKYYDSCRTLLLTTDPSKSSGSP